MRKGTCDGSQARQIDESLHQEVHVEGTSLRDLHVLQQRSLGASPDVHAVEALQRGHSLPDSHQAFASEEIICASLLFYRFPRLRCLTFKIVQRGKFQIQVSGSTTQFTCH